VARRELPALGVHVTPVLPRELGRGTALEVGVPLLWR
jgi:hypothetical protein